jgi:hypothetical protein
MQFDAMGKMLIVFGLIIVGIGALLVLGARLPWLGKLPGDLSWHGDNVNVFIPITTSILLSVVLTVVLNVVSGLFGRR